MSKPTKTILIPAWETSRAFLKLSQPERDEITRKLLYIQEHRYEVPRLITFSAGYTGETDNMAQKVAIAKVFNQKVLEMMYTLAYNFLEKNIPLSTPPPPPPELTGQALLLHYWGDDDEY